MAFHCSCGVRSSECDYPNCITGEREKRKPEPPSAQDVYNLLIELRRQIDDALEKLGGV